MPVVCAVFSMDSPEMAAVIVGAEHSPATRMVFLSPAWETREPIPVGAVAYWKGALAFHAVTAVMVYGHVMMISSLFPVSARPLSMTAAPVVLHLLKNATA
tara:strand:- start:6 stop:308 length:303 start_codon:yes stop_codon:yes gene_type:complete